MAKSKADETHPAISFLRTLYELTPGGFVELRAIANDKVSPPRRIFARTAPELVAFAEKFGQKDSKYGVYFGICKRETETGTKKSITRVPVLWVDLDTVKNGWDTDEMVKRIHAISGVLRPSACVRSGGGLHLYWFLSDVNLRESAEIVNAQLRDVFAGDAVQNADRIFRLPGTWNTKRKPAKRVEVAWCYGFERKSLAQITLAAQGAKNWLGEKGEWAAQRTVIKGEEKRELLSNHHVDAFVNAYTAGRRASKDMEDMWTNRVRYNAPRGYIGIHEASVRYTAHLACVLPDITEDKVVEMTMANIQSVKDRDAPSEQWDLEREAKTVREMYRSWLPKWREYQTQRRTEQKALRKKADGNTGRVRGVLRGTAATAGGRRNTSAKR